MALLVAVTVRGVGRTVTACSRCHRAGYSSRKAVSDLEPLARTVDIRARGAGRLSVRGLVSMTRSIVPSSGSRWPGPRVASWVGTRLAAIAEMPMAAADAPSGAVDAR